MSIGVDLGGSRIAIVDLDQRFFCTYDASKAHYDRGTLSNKMKEWLERQTYIGERPVWVEAPVLAGARNIQSTIKVAQTSGVVHAVLAQTFEVPVSSWKKRIVGNGNASKDQVRVWLDDRHPDVAYMCRGDQDLYDAACIALYGRAVHEELEVSGLSVLRGQRATADAGPN